MSAFWRRFDPAVATAFGCILSCCCSSAASIRAISCRRNICCSSSRSPRSSASIASGMMLAILLGQIDLSLPWVVTVGAMMSCAIGGHGLDRRDPRRSLAASCAASRSASVNGFGVAYLRIPSMIVTLATNAVAQGLMVVYTGGFSPQDFASPVMRYFATGFAIPGVPNAVLCWAVSALATVILLNAHDLRARIYGIGNRERAPISRESTRGASS